MDFSAFDAYIDSHAEQFIADLVALAAIPSTEHNPSALQDAVQQVIGLANRAGIATEAISLRTDRPPIITGSIGAEQPILMIYNHYDVQPAEPLDRWVSPPFEPAIREGHLYGRGVADNKVNLVARIVAVEAWRQVFGALPVHLRFVWEGEEESGGLQLARFTREYAAWLAQAAGCVWESGYRDDSGAPVITLGVKGLACLELRVKTGSLDAHSGQGGIVPNAAWRLLEALQTLRAPDGTVLIDGFADRIEPLSEADRALLTALPFNVDEFCRQYGITGLVGGRDGLAAQEALFFGTTCTINGLSAGYEGAASKTIVPCEALAKLDLRLVPNLDPDTVVVLLRAHLDRRGFEDVEVFAFEGNTMPARTQPDTAIAQAAIEALNSAYGRPPLVHPVSPGSGPMYELCQAHGVPAVNFGCGWSGSQIHAPNENIRIADFMAGIKAFGRMIEAFPRHYALKNS